MQTATDYSQPLFVQRGSETVSKAFVKQPGTIKSNMLCLLIDSSSQSKLKMLFLGHWIQYQTHQCQMGK